MPLDARFVNGFMYSRRVPRIGSGKPPSRLPPKPVLKLVTHLHPAFRQRSKQAEAALTERPFARVVDRWNTEIRPQLRVENLAFEAFDVACRGRAQARAEGRLGAAA